MAENIADTRFVYSARGTWFGSIHEVGKTASGLPCCPHCGSPLFEYDSEAIWWDQVDKYDATHPGYRLMWEWARGKCFPNMAALEKAYAESRSGQMARRAEGMRRG